MRGTRVQPDENGYYDGRMNPGEYVRVAPVRNHDGTEFTGAEKGKWWTQPYWMVCTPNGHVGMLGKHEIVEHEDGTITVSPSIVISNGKQGTPEYVEYWHGYLKHGVFETLGATGRS